MTRVLTPLLAVALVLAAGPAFAATALGQTRCPVAPEFQGAPPRGAPPAEAWPTAGAYSDRPIGEPIAQALQAALDQAATRAAPLSIAVAVWRPGQGIWSARWDAPGVEPRPLHWWASAGKLATAASVLQLVQEGRLSLDAPLTTWRDDVSHGDQITVDQLLVHTSGLFSANEDLAYRAVPHAMDVDEQVAVAERNGAVFCPGAAWRYSNTGYALLGQIVAAEDGRPWSEAVQARTFARLGVADAELLTPDSDLSVVQPLGPPPPGEPAVDPRWPGAAGGVAATPLAMIRLLHGILADGLVAPENAHAMLARSHQMFGQPMWYGRGLILYEAPAPDGSSALWVGHSGGAPGAGSIVAWSAQHQAYVAVVFTGRSSAEAIANMLLTALADSGGV